MKTFTVRIRKDITCFKDISFATLDEATARQSVQDRLDNEEFVSESEALLSLPLPEGWRYTDAYVTDTPKIQSVAEQLDKALEAS